jgi:hypothetical protein
MERSAAIQPEPAARSATVVPTDRAGDRTVAIACAILLLIGMPIGYLPGSSGDVVALIVVSLISLAVMPAIVVWFLPRERARGAERATRTALILGALAVISGVVFWLALPFAFGAAAIALGLSLRDPPAPAEVRGRATAAAVLGAFAVVASFVLLLIG